MQKHLDTESNTGQETLFTLEKTEMEVGYLGFAIAHQRPHEGHVAAGGDVSVGVCWLGGRGFGAGGGLPCQAGLIHGQFSCLWDGQKRGELRN